MPDSWFSEEENRTLFEEGDKERIRKRRKGRRGGRGKRGRGKVGKSAETDNTQEETTDENEDCEEIITKALSYWAILYDIPFNYLVPHENMLPDNSLRFFFMDSNWIRTMLDGALSIGRNTKSDLEHDRIFIDDIYADSISAASEIRLRLQRKITDEASSAEQVKTFDVCSGFIMRSPLVTGWRGLDFQAVDSENNLLKALRIETLAADILLGIYIGQIKKLSIYEPPEGLHFEVMRGKDGRYLRLRDKATGKENGLEIPVVTKGYKNNPEMSSRVVDFRAFANEMGSDSNSADFALQMIKLPSYAEFAEV